jgi:hypothetical protein
MPRFRGATINERGVIGGIEAAAGQGYWQQEFYKDEAAD